MQTAYNLRLSRCVFVIGVCETIVPSYILCKYNFTNAILSIFPTKNALTRVCDIFQAVKVERDISVRPCQIQNQLSLAGGASCCSWRGCDLTGNTSKTICQCLAYQGLGTHSNTDAERSIYSLPRGIPRRQDTTLAFDNRRLCPQGFSRPPGQWSTSS